MVPTDRRRARRLARARVRSRRVGRRRHAVRALRRRCASHGRRVSNAARVTPRRRRRTESQSVLVVVEIALATRAVGRGRVVDAQLRQAGQRRSWLRPGARADLSGRAPRGSVRRHGSSRLSPKISSAGFERCPGVECRRRMRNQLPMVQLRDTVRGAVADARSPDRRHADGPDARLVSRGLSESDGDPGRSRGEASAPDDDASQPRVLLINEALARSRLRRSRIRLATTVFVGRDPDSVALIVGIVGRRPPVRSQPARRSRSSSPTCVSGRLAGSMPMFPSGRVTTPIRTDGRSRVARSRRCARIIQRAGPSGDHRRCRAPMQQVVASSVIASACSTRCCSASSLRSAIGVGWSSACTG